MKSIGDVGGGGGGGVGEVFNTKSMTKKKSPATTYEILNVSMIQKRTNDITSENESVECMQAYIEQGNEEFNNMCIENILFRIYMFKTENRICRLQLNLNLNKYFITYFHFFFTS